MTEKSISNAINQNRLWERHMELAKIGATLKGGVNREAFTEEEIQARKLLAKWTKNRGFSCSIDPIGNLFFRREGKDPNADPVVTGSHIDSQPTGGKFDGAYGVLAGLEVLESAEDIGVETNRPLEFVAWTNEEGGRFQPATMGSGVYVGAMDFDQMLDVSDKNGVKVGDVLPEALNAIPGANQRNFGSPMAAYIEAHIEQGPILEKQDKTIGVVTGIQGCRWFAIDVFGSEAHAGSTPFALRKDAFKAAHSMINNMYKIFTDDEDILRFTIGRFEVLPNSPNTIPGKVFFTVDFRHPNAEILNNLGDQIETICEKNSHGLKFKINETYTVPPTIFDLNVVGTIRESANAHNFSVMDITSGALHDAKYMNDICPSGMIFIPCEGGLSHNELEAAQSEDIAAGTRVLAETMVSLANQ